MPSLHPRPPNTSPPRGEKWYSCAICGTQLKQIHLLFTSGSVEPTVGETFTGASSSDTGVVVESLLSTGTWAGDELLSNPGFETAGAGGADVFANWTESTTGSSTVNDETSSVHGGSDACRLDIDASNNTAGVFYYAIPLTASGEYRLTFWYKNSESGKTAKFYVRTTDTTHYYLESAGTWTSSLTYISLDNVTEYTQYAINFSAHEDHTSYRLYFRTDSAASSSIYIDDVSIKRGDATGYVTLSGGTGVSDIDKREWGTDGETINGSTGGTDMLTMTAGWEYTNGIMYPRSMIRERDGRYYCDEHYHAKFTPIDRDEIVVDFSDIEDDIRTEDY